MDNKSEVQEKYMEFQMVEQQIKEVSQHIQELDNKLMELEYIKMSLDEVGSIKKGSEILAPVSSGIFVKAEIKDNSRMLVNVGGNTVVVRSISETKQLIDDQLKEVESMRDSLLIKSQQLTSRAQGIEQALNKMINEG